MTKFSVKQLALVSLIVMGLAGASGCAKKHKPDAGAENGGVIVDKPMDFAAVGSDSLKIDGLYSVHFDYDKSALTSETRDLLVKDAQWIKSHPNMNLQIEGHCDRHGSTEYNLALGERRAKAVKAYLLNLGIKANRLSTISYGKEKLLDDAETDAADAKNRRANFKPIETVKVKSMSQR